jgi:predicted deacetylase
LLVSIHDVGPRFESEVDRLASLIGGILERPRFAMLVVPDHWGEAPLSKAPAFCRRLRDWSDAGIEMFAHGWFHRDFSAHSGLDRLKARTMTAGEGEFLGLDSQEAAKRMADGKALIEDVIGREVAGFVAPAWLYGPGSRTALPSSGFRLAEDHMRVWQPQTGETVARGPVITWASRSRQRQMSSLAFAGIARHALRVLPTVRIAVHPGDTTVPALMASIRRTISAFAAQRTAGRYLDLLNPLD